MPKHVTYDSSQLTLRAEELVSASSNRYKITVQVANRAKRRRYEDFDNDDQVLKPVIRAVLEMCEELTQQDIIGGE